MLYSDRKALLVPAARPATGANREGLHSLILRICEKNQLTVNDVVCDLIDTRAGSRGDCLARAANVSHLVDRGGSVSTRFIARIEFLTTATGLHDLTLRELVALQGVGAVNVSRYRKWCPVCYEEDVAAGFDPYARLMWSIEDVKVCPIHRVRLQTACATCGKQSFRMLTGRDISGRCPRCLAWLGNRALLVDESRDDHSRFLLWVARSYFDLLDTSLSSELDIRPGFRIVLLQLNNHHFNGVYSKLAQAIERNHSIVSRWVSSNGSPSWQALCEISFVFQVPLLDLLTGQTDAVAISSVRRLPHAALSRINNPKKLPERRDLTKIDAFLKKVEKGEVSAITSFTKVAERLGMHPHDLRRLSPDRAKRLSALLALRKAEISRMNNEARKLTLELEINRAVESLAGQSKLLNRRSITAELADRGLLVRRDEGKLAYGFMCRAIETAGAVSGNK